MKALLTTTTITITVLTLILHYQAVAGLEARGEVTCYCCSDCGTSTPTDANCLCKTSCETVVACFDDQPPLVSRKCSLGNMNTNCTRDAATDSYTCHCNNDYCDPLIGRDICNGASSNNLLKGTVSLLVAVAPLVLTQFLK